MENDNHSILVEPTLDELEKQVSRSQSEFEDLLSELKAIAPDAFELVGELSAIENLQAQIEATNKLADPLIEEAGKEN